MRQILILLLAAGSSFAADLTALVGTQITPDKAADSGSYLQSSRSGPAGELEYHLPLTLHHGLVLEAGYANTNTRLSDYVLNRWTMNRMNIDVAYAYQVHLGGRVTSFLKAGAGSLMTFSGRAPNGLSAGMDSRLEEIAGFGIGYKWTNRLSLVAEYECHFFRNPDFSDHNWHPARNEVSQPSLGIRYNFGSRE